MGIMKSFLMNCVEEFAEKEGLTLKEVYESPEMYRKACAYADEKLRAFVKCGLVGYRPEGLERETDTLADFLSAGVSPGPGYFEI